MWNFLSLWHPGTPWREDSAEVVQKRWSLKVNMFVTIFTVLFTSWLLPRFFKRFIISFRFFFKRHSFHRCFPRDFSPTFFLCHTFGSEADWNEEDYDPDKAAQTAHGAHFSSPFFSTFVLQFVQLTGTWQSQVDQRSQYELRVIAKYKMRHGRSVMTSRLVMSGMSGTRKEWRKHDKQYKKTWRKRVMLRRCGWLRVSRTGKYGTWESRGLSNARVEKSIPTPFESVFFEIFFQTGNSTLRFIAFQSDVKRAFNLVHFQNGFSLNLWTSSASSSRDVRKKKVSRDTETSGFEGWSALLHSTLWKKFYTSLIFFSNVHSACHPSGYAEILLPLHLF